MKPRVLVAGAKKNGARQLARALKMLPLEVHVAVEERVPGPLESYRLLVLQPSGKRPDWVAHVMAGAAPDAHAVVVTDRLDVQDAAAYLQDPRVNHILGGDRGLECLPIVAQKLASGAIFGLDWYLPSEATVAYRRLTSFKQRCETIEALGTDLRERRIRGSLAEATLRVLEELLMNAMYQAPFEDGRRVFGDVDPKLRLRKKTPRPVSVRYAIHDQRVFVCVRDRYGSFERADLASCLLRCATSNVQIEQKRLGAGLGLYLIASTVRGLVVNILPGMVSEFICMLGPRTERDLAMLSVTTQRADIFAQASDGEAISQLDRIES